ncbi:MAG: tRNA guanosine(34) transglycosylase Tgt [Deltaproteobacteria bacterium]|nr:tRNA guanosine(34) transglycosylase Tgt [Deltaproteobacteria bacterium]
MLRSRRVRFELRKTASGSRARLGRLTTLHSEVPTPVFMPVGTRGTVRTQGLERLEAFGARLILANTYHLLVRPGPELFEKFGGIHRWIGWRESVLTDSGGFQVFSLGCTIDETGAAFRAGPTGPRIALTPERSIAMQRAIGSDIMMAFDQCIDSTSGHDQARDAMERTHRWAARSLVARGESPQALFGIVQGACFEDLRRESARVLGEMAFDGFGIGGLAVGETKAQREDMTALTAELLPREKPRYLMGVGTPLDILEAVHRGVDMFDCIMPTAWAQHGRAFTSHGRLDIRRGVHKLADQPIDAACDCDACTRHSRSYLHHLVKESEPLGWRMLATHNLRFYLRLMDEIRAAIEADTFAAYYATKREELARDDVDNPAKRPEPRKAATRGAFGVRIGDEFASIEHLASGEVMHSVVQPDAEAEAVYVRQSKLLASQKPLVVWDVGLGAAHNAMALIRALEAAPRAPVEIVSFERDLDAFRLALANTGPFAHLRHRAPHVLAQHKKYERDGVTWRLVEGDFLAHYASAPQPDLIFWDPFSQKVDGALWTLATFRALYAHLRGPVELFTYSASTAVRTSLLAAGFRVARGVATGPKEETTIAVKGDVEHPWLGAEWLERRARSTARFGADVPEALYAEVDAAVENHPQFSSIMRRFS